MEFKNEKSVYDFMRKSKYLGFGQEGECYVDQKRKFAYKFYNSFLDSIEDNEPSKEKILAFKDVKSNLVMFPQDIITLDSMIIGDISNYANGKNLYRISPYPIGLNRLIRLCELALKELELLTKQGIRCYDIIYNMLLGDQIYLIDGSDYFWSDLTYEETLAINKQQFNLSIMYFLISGIFEEVISNNKILQEMYDTLGNDISIIEFINRLKNYLSEIVGKEITNLGEARKLKNKHQREVPYARLIEL